MPNGTAQIARSVTSPCRPPRATQRRSPIQTAATMPRMIEKAYARSGTGPRYQTPSPGLGMLQMIVRRSCRVLGSRGGSCDLSGQQRWTSAANSAAEVSSVHTIGTRSSASIPMTWVLWVTS